jgi:hypothetical protein
VRTRTKTELVNECRKKDAESADSCAGDTDHKGTKPELRIFDADEELMGLETFMGGVLAFSSVR